MSKEDFWKTAKLKLKVDDDKIAKIRKIWHGGYKPIKGMKELVQILRKNYRVIAFSGNIKERIEYLDRKYGLMNDFDDFVLSYNIGCSKLSLDFYKAMVKKLRCQPSQAVFIDDRQEFVDIAKSLGLHGIVFTGVEQVKNDLKKLKVNV
ncbi:MAG: HAD-IA family hydrolase [Candidatus Omnitrophica bacterium]|nr:HAD-IA family hydrolase [Candidatus Omnitrophota bacterium]MBU1134625.1 HAD-IA family hydrolase [Candidatus Omnitrophota bacterium]MBU1778123.1 HAD-IA family hydrolase [Patescibacteria group bacterium]